MYLFFSIAFGFMTLLQATAAYAFNLPTAPCVTTVPGGCNAGAENFPMRVLTGGGNGGLAMMMLQVAAGLAVLFIVWAGIQMLISLGDEGKITQYKWAIAYSLIGLTVAILSQLLVSTVGTQTLPTGSSDLPLTLLSTAVYILRTLLNAIFLIIIVVAGLHMVYAQGKSEDYEKGKKMMYWAITGAVIVNLSAALVTVVTNFFGL